VNFAELLAETPTATPETPVRAKLANGQTREIASVQVEHDDEGRRVAVWLTLAAE
jgi:hypothetical protein